MGVRGLQSYLESHCPSACYSVNLGKLSDDYFKKMKRRPLIVIDGMSCLRKVYGKLVWIAGGQWKGYVEHLENFVKKLRSHEIKFVFFFDGNTPERKRETWIHRRLENLKDVANYFNMIKNNKELEHGKHFFLPPGLAAFTPLILKDVLNCEVYTCLDECDQEVAEYARMNAAMGILGQDSDYVIYNTAPYYFSSNHLNLDTLDTIVYDRNALAKTLHLTVDQLPVLSCLIVLQTIVIEDNRVNPCEDKYVVYCAHFGGNQKALHTYLSSGGNDVIPQELLTLFHKQFLRGSDHSHRHSNRSPSEILIPKVASFISNQPPMEQLMNQLPHLSKAVFREDTMAEVLNNGIKMYLLDCTDDKKYHPIDPEIYKESNIYEKVRLRHMNSELGRHLYTVMRGEPYESSTTLEDYTHNMPSNGLVYRPMRARVYRIIQKSCEDELPHVLEWCMYNGNNLKSPDRVEPLDTPDGLPSLEELWEGSDELKWKTFCDCIHKDLIQTKVKSLPEYLIFPVCLLFYLQCSQPRPVLKDWEVGAMLASFISPIRKDLTLVRCINLPRIDARAVHIATVFVKGLVNLYLLLATCDFPLNRKFCVPWEFWDGKVFHHFYLRGKAGVRVEDLVDKKEDLYKLYIEMKTMIHEYTPHQISLTSKKLSPSSSQCSGSPKKRAPSPSTSEVTATPPHSPNHVPGSVRKTKHMHKSPLLSPTGANSPKSKNLSEQGGKSSAKSPTKSKSKSPS